MLANLGGSWPTVQGLAAAYNLVEFYETVGEYFGLIDPDAWRTGVVEWPVVAETGIRNRTNEIKTIVDLL